MRILPAQPDAARQDATIESVPLVRIITYSDFTLGTVEREWRFSDRTIVYDGDEYTPALFEVSAQTETITHLGTLDDPSTIARPRQVVIELLNAEDWDGTGQYLYELMRATNLEYSSVVVSELLLDKGADPAPGDAVVWYRGSLKKVRDVDLQTFIIEVGALRPEFPRIYINNPGVGGANPDAQGQRVPIVYGRVLGSEAFSYDGYWRTTTADEVTENTDIVTLTYSEILDEIDPGPGEGFLAGLLVEWDGVSNGNLFGFRFAAGTASGLNTIPVGTEIIGVPAVGHTLVVADQASAVEAVYLRNPLNDLMTVVPPEQYTVNLNDTSVIPGETVVSVRQTQENLFDMARVFAAAGRVTQQPQYTDTGGGQPSPTEITPDNLSIADKSNAENVAWDTSGAPTDVIVANEPPTGPPYDRTRLRAQVNTVPTPTGSVTQTRISFEATATSLSGTAGPTMVATIRGVTGIADGTTISRQFTAAAQTRTFEFPAGGEWAVAQAGATQQTLINDQARITIHMVQTTGSSAYTIDIDLTGAIEVSSSTRGFLEQEIEARISVMQGAIGETWKVDVVGPVVPDGAYYDNVGEVIQRPIDIFRHLLNARAGIPHTAIGARYLETSAPVQTMAVNLDEMGGAPLERILWEAGLQLLERDTQTTARFEISGPTGVNTWPAASRTITEYGEIREEGRDINSMFNVAITLWNPDRALPLSQPAAYMDAWVQEDSASQLIHGRRERPPNVLISPTVEGEIQAWTTMHLREMVRLARTLFVEDVPWVDAYDLERDDIVEIQPAWASAPVKCRIVGYSKRWRETVADLVLVEVE